MNWRSKPLLILIVLMLSIALAACASGKKDDSGQAPAPKTQFLTITTASTGGTYYPIGVAMGTLWTEKLIDQGIKVSAQSSAGSVENIDILQG